MADRVLDGTPCGPYENDLCVYGRCQVTCVSYCPWRGCEERVLLPPEWAHGGVEASEGQGEWVFPKRFMLPLWPMATRHALTLAVTEHHECGRLNQQPPETI